MQKNKNKSSKKNKIAKTLADHVNAACLPGGQKRCVDFSGFDSSAPAAKMRRMHSTNLKRRLFFGSRSLRMKKNTCEANLPPHTVRSMYLILKTEKGETRECAILFGASWNCLKTNK